MGVDLLFTDGDEFTDGRMLGTEHFLAHLPAGPRPAFAVVLEPVGDRDAWFPRDAGSRRHAPAVVRRVWGTARQMGATPSSPPRPRKTAPARTCASPRRGSPPLLVSDPVVRAGQLLLAHRQRPSLQASRETLAQVGEVMAEIIYRGIPATK